MYKLYSVAYPIIWTFLKIFHPWKYKGAENIPEGAVLICGNHTSLGDPFYVMCSAGFKTKLRIMAKDELMRIPVLGYLLKNAGVIGIKRGKSDVGAIKEGMRTLKNGEKLLIFPEGTRVKEGQSAEIHTGAAMFATRTGVPILPVYISPDKKWFRTTHVVFGQPYTPEFEGKRPTSEDYERISEDLMARIKALGGEVS